MTTGVVFEGAGPRRRPRACLQRPRGIACRAAAPVVPLWEWSLKLHLHSALVNPIQARACASRLSAATSHAGRGGNRSICSGRAGHRLQSSIRPAPPRPWHLLAAHTLPPSRSTRPTAAMTTTDNTIALMAGCGVMLWYATMLAQTKNIQSPRTMRTFAEFFPFYMSQVSSLPGRPRSARQPPPLPCSTPTGSAGSPTSSPP
jgi:hypothetical protein